MSTDYPRNQFDTILKSLSYFPVTLIQGPRQVGKSFLLNKILEQGLLREIRALDNLKDLLAAESDPHAYIESLPKPIGIDEVQRCPSLLLAIKKYVDENRNPGDFVLTGSAHLYAYPTTLESLAGRMSVITLDPLSLNEIQKTLPTNLFEILLSEGSLSSSQLQEISSGFLNPEVWDRALCGGFPSLVATQDIALRDL